MRRRSSSYFAATLLLAETRYSSRSSRPSSVRNFAVVLKGQCMLLSPVHLRPMGEILIKTCIILASACCYRGLCKRSLHTFEGTLEAGWKRVLSGRPKVACLIVEPYP